MGKTYADFSQHSKVTSFDGTITDSLTTYDPVECEFVQVQDKDNYLNGQF